MLDFTTTAVSRPAIIDKTYASFQKNLKDIDLKECTLYINIDPFPPDSNRAKVVEVCKRYFKTVVYRTPSEANFTGAINWLWTQATSPLIFHIEDDWKLVKPVSLMKLISFFTTNPYLLQVALRAYPYKYDRCCLSPSLIAKKFYKSVAGNLDESLNPEVQLRGHVFGIDLPSKDMGISHKGKVVVFPEKDIVLKDMGRAWIEQTHFTRPPKKNQFTSWIEK